MVMPDTGLWEIWHSMIHRCFFAGSYIHLAEFINLLKEYLSIAENVEIG